MQDKYVGDIGDYIKLALLRQLQPGHRVGVVWWLFPDEVSSPDGRHTAYLDDPKWERFDPELYGKLRHIVRTGQRNVAALQHDSVLLDGVFVDSMVPISVEARRLWVKEAVLKVAECDVVFLDPDNGLEPRTFTPGRRAAGKSVSYEELAAFRAPGRTLVVYHHQTRAPGGHLNEIGTLETKLDRLFDRVDAVRASPRSPRVFFVLDASPEVVERLKELCDWWGDKLSLNPHRST